jgi:hypothetical protein
VTGPLHLLSGNASRLGKPWNANEVLPSLNVSAMSFSTFISQLTELAYNCFAAHQVLNIKMVRKFRKLRKLISVSEIVIFGHGREHHLYSLHINKVWLVNHYLLHVLKLNTTAHLTTVCR